MSIDLSLDRISKLLNHLGPYTRPTCHIAGTNGKGSVSSLLSSILLSSSPPLSVGRFNSPHLASVLDAIYINRSPISRAQYADARALVEQADKEHAIGASNFELLTTTALLIFESEPVDIVVLEVGMGGRLDATNVVPDDCILVSALTAVDLDHQAFLGNTVADIAREKAGIARRGKPFVIGAQKHAEVEVIVRNAIARIGGDVIPTPLVVSCDWDKLTDGPSPSPVSFLSPPSFPPSHPVEITLPCFTEPVRALLPLHGNHQLLNLAIVCGMVFAILTHPSCLPTGFHERITPYTIARGIQSTRWPGRLSFHTLPFPLSSDTSQTEEIAILADGAHNPASATALAAYLGSLLSSRGCSSPHREIFLTYVLALSHSPPKTPLQTLAPLFALREHAELRLGVALLRFTSPEGMPWVRFVPPSELREAVEALVPDKSADIWVPAETEGDPREELRNALAWAARRRREGEEALVVVAGSLYLVADFYREFSGCLRGADAAS